MLVLISLYIAFIAMGFVYYAIYNPAGLPHISALSFFVFGIIAWRKALSLGWQNVRAKLIAFLGTGGFFISFGFMLSGDISTILFLTGYAFLIIGVILMLINLLKMGYSLEMAEWLQVTIINAVVALFAIYMGYINGISPFGWIMTGISLLLIFIASIVLRIFWGSDLGIRWTIGVIAAILLAIATVTMSSYNSTQEIVYLVIAHGFYTLSGMLMGLLYTLQD